MSKISTILLSIALTLLSSESAFGQYQGLGVGQNQDPRLAGEMQANDGLDAIYDDINNHARQSQAAAEKPVRDIRSYNQFMDQTGANLAVEQANVAKFAAARQRDALTTGAYEQKRINDTADWEKSQLLGSSRSVRHGRYSYSVPTNNINTNNYYVYSGSPNAAQFQSIDRRRQRGLAQSQDNVNSRLHDSQALANTRDQSLEDVANSLRDQVLSTQSSAKRFGLQGVGTNLYVRQYGRPEANLPPVHNAAARIVPMGTEDN